MSKHLNILSHHDGAPAPEPESDRARPRFWRSLAELARTPAFRDFVSREFPEATFSPLDPVGRRRFLQLMGASFALAGCRWEAEKILPHSRRPHGQVPGETERYRTILETGGHAVGIEATSYDGRPIKLEGHPEHPSSQGGTSATIQARILELYDPERSQRFTRRDGDGHTASTREAFLGKLRDARQLALESRGARLAVVADASEAPTRQRLEATLLAELPETAWVDWSPLDRAAEREAAEIVYGEALRPLYDFGRAARIVALDADPLGTHPMSLAHLRAWAARRSPDAEGDSRLYAIESSLSTTGMSADHRLPLASTEIGAFAVALATAVASRLKVESPVSGEVPTSAAPWIGPIADDLVAHRRELLIVAGDAQPAAVHAVAAWLNDALGAVGRTVRYVRAPERANPMVGLVRVAERLRAGEIDTLVILGANPAYDAPGDVDFATAMAKAKTVFHAGLQHDETAERAGWHAPLAHPLACWGDGRAYDGTVSIQQPLLKPLFEGVAPIELLAELAGEREASAEALVRETFARLGQGEPIMGPTQPAKLPVALPGTSERAWRKALSRGLVEDTAYPSVTPEMAGSRWKVPSATRTDETSLELTFFDDGKLDGGRLANNAWLQELPESRTKLVWDNALLVGPATAEALGVEHEDVVALERDGAELQLPVYVLPGQAKGTGAVALGYGRRRAGYVGGDAAEGVSVGVDVTPLRRSNSPWLATNVRLRKTGRRYPLATTQDHWAIDELGRKERERRSHHLVREVSREAFAADPDIVRDQDHHPPLKSLWTKEQREGPQWGMSIDLSKCVGCNACVTACQSENNIPVVGKEQVLMGREMHWLRIDRYFQGEAEAPTVAQQPLACAHCESAPCEQVCPVAATVHSHEGTNDMVYNRCIGTRYCANNCPYKVRRFNFLDYHEDLDRGGESNGRVRLMVHNPDVTVRHRGVMEKCTYCTQRIKGAKHDARIEGRDLVDGDVTPACAQACPTQAIVFGDLNDDGSRVSVTHADKRSYALLAELNIAPRTRYLARITNPNPVLASVTGATAEGT